MLNNVYQLLKKRKNQQAQDRFHLGPEWKAQTGLDTLVVTTQWGTPLGKGYLNNGLQTLISTKIQREYPDFEYITSHGLRHTFATRCIENGMTPQVLKVIMGHSKLSITMDLYVHVLPDAKYKEMQKIANLF